MATTVRIPVGIPTEALDAIALVGKIVTYDHQQYKVYSVEGYDWYAFQSSEGTVTADFQMTAAEYKRSPLAFLLPMGCKITDGFGFEVRTTHIRRGVCIGKQRA